MNRQNKKIMKAPGVLMTSTVIYVVMCIVLFAGGVSIGYQFVENYKKDLLIHQCDVIDLSLIHI